MALSKFGFIVTGAGYDPDRHRAIMASEGLETIMIGVSKPEQGVAVALEMLENGIQLLELCGGFGPAGTALILEAVRGRIPVGAVAYGPEAIEGMHALFSG